MVIRLDDLKHEKEKIELLYSKTTYYDSLMTNRAMDYEWPNGETIRDIYEPGPFISPLKDSKLSNHLGFNGFIETSDGKIIFVRRGNKVSIGKNIIASSISASLKAKYVYNEDLSISTERLSDAMREEIKGELKIDIDKKERMDRGIFAFYRDLLEGGKPQFLFYYKLEGEEFSFEKIKDNFKPSKMERKIGDVDGGELIPLSREDLYTVKMEIDKIFIPGLNDKKVGTSPNVVMSLEL